MANPSKIIGSFWFTEYNGRSFGIVKVQTSDGLRFYIGNARGKEEKEDAAHIHKYGSPLNSDQLTRFLDTPLEKGNKPVKIDSRKYHNELLGAMMIGIGLGLAIATYFL